MRRAPQEKKTTIIARPDGERTSGTVPGRKRRLGRERREGVTGLGKIHEYHIAELALGVVGDSDEDDTGFGRGAGVSAAGRRVSRLGSPTAAAVAAKR